MRGLVGLCAAILVLMALSLGQSVIAPVIFALFVIAPVWPLQRAIQARLPRMLALLVTMVAALVALIGLGVIIAWAFGRGGTWVVANAAMLQMLCAQKIVWLEAQGIPDAGLLIGHFDVRWL